MPFTNLIMTMTDLSPAAQAILDALYMDELNGPQQLMALAHAIAALRAVADQVVPHLEEPDWGAHNDGYCDIELYTDHQRKRAQLLAIATELEERDATTI
jgi:hypothetical protein